VNGLALWHSELNKYRIGTSGYQFPDWFGTVYPPSLRQRNVLEYYANSLGLDTVEVNYTYYRLPSPRTSEAMARKVPDDFEFVVRSFSGMTHDIWEGTDRKTLKDTTEVFDQFVQGILPFKEAGKLGPVLLQFPYSFWPNRITYDYLKWCREKLRNCRTLTWSWNSGTGHGTARAPFSSSGSWGWATA